MFIYLYKCDNIHIFEDWGRITSVIINGNLLTHYFIFKILDIIVTVNKPF